MPRRRLRYRRLPGERSISDQPKRSESFMVAIFFSIVLIGTVTAHDDRQSIEKAVGGYLFDIGYDTVSFQSGESVEFDFTLYKKEEDYGAAVLYSNEPSEFTYVWVQIAPRRQGSQFGGRFRS